MSSRSGSSAPAITHANIGSIVRKLRSLGCVLERDKAGTAVLAIYHPSGSDPTAPFAAFGPASAVDRTVLSPLWDRVLGHVLARETVSWQDLANVYATVVPQAQQQQQQEQEQQSVGDAEYQVTMAGSAPMAIFSGASAGLVPCVKYTFPTGEPGGDYLPAFEVVTGVLEMMLMACSIGAL